MWCSVDETQVNEPDLFEFIVDLLTAKESLLSLNTLAFFISTTKNSRQKLVPWRLSQSGGDSLSVQWI